MSAKTSRPFRKNLMMRNHQSCVACLKPWCRTRGGRNCSLAARPTVIGLMNRLGRPFCSRCPRQSLPVASRLACTAWPTSYLRPCRRRSGSYAMPSREPRVHLAAMRALLVAAACQTAVNGVRVQRRLSKSIPSYERCPSGSSAASAPFAVSSTPAAARAT